MSAFTELGIMPELGSALDSMGWLLPTEIQAEAIPLILGGGDILMASETGTGKTGAFCLPLVQIVYEQLLDSAKDDKSCSPIAKKPNLTTEWKLSIQDRAPDLVLGGDLLTARTKSGNWQGCRANKGIRKPRNLPHQPSRLRVYYEVHFSEQGLARVGWSFAEASFDLGTDRFGYGYGGTGKKSNNRQFDDYGQPFGEKFDIVGCILDLSSGELSFTKNGRYLGVAFKIPFKQLESSGLFPSICVKNAGCLVRFGPTEEKNDYKPSDCIWVSELDANFIFKNDNLNRASQRNNNSPLAIIMEPSRELARQTHDCLQTFAKGLSINCSLCIGGKSEVGLPTAETPHIIVCTPGRLDSAVRSNQINLNNIHFFILDEADCLLQQGHKYLINQVHSKLPKMFESGRRLQVICCSATLHNFEVKKLADQLMYFPIWIDLKGEDSVPDTVHHVVFRVDPLNDTKYRDLKDSIIEVPTDDVHTYDDDVEDVLFSRKPKQLSRDVEFSEAIKLMKPLYVLKAIECLRMDQGIIFCRTKYDCDNLSEFMDNEPDDFYCEMYSNVTLHSSLSQREREDNLRDFKAKKYRFLICTDVAARGIDVKEVPFVIQMTLPDEKTNYIHRIGRVGRADRMGLALSLVATKPEKVWYHKCYRNERNCNNSKLVEQGGCCIWFDELGMLGEIEQHLKCSIQEIGPDFKLQVDEYDGKVVYGAKRLEQTLTYEGHVEQLKTIVSDLCALETKAQSDYLLLYH